MRIRTDGALRLFYHVEMVEAALTLSELFRRQRLPELWPPDTNARIVRFRLTGARDSGFEVSWVLLSPPPRSTEALVREVRVADAAEARLQSSPEETTASLAAAGLVSVHDRVVTPATLDALLEFGTRVPIPLAPATPPFDSDLPWWTLSFLGGGNDAQLGWQGEGPESWRPFVHWIDNLRQTLHELAHGLTSRQGRPNG
jgi:hypothetical protein